MPVVERAMWWLHDSPIRRGIDMRLGIGRFGRVRCLGAVWARTARKRGLEVGGPSSIFRREGVVPLYDLAGAMDGCNFGDRTVWEGKIEHGAPFRFDPRRTPGRQMISEATTLPEVSDGQYDFVASSHCLEHVANPLRALREWRRVVRPGGALVLVVPDPRHIFDRRRPITRFDHLVDDYERDVGEDDLTHFDEIMALHDLTLDPAAGTPEQFRTRSLQNATNRCFHHHVFSPELAVEAVRWAGFRDVAVELNSELHIVVVADAP